jgi:hypothetical protein
MTSSDSLRQMLARFEITSPLRMPPVVASDASPATVNGIDILRRLLQDATHAAAG